MTNVYSLPKKTNWEEYLFIYCSRRYTALPVPPGTKKPLIPDWTQMAIGEMAYQQRFAGNQGCNIGIVTGSASGGLVDVDIDADVALRLAPYCLPATPMKTGRASRPESHWFYTVKDPASVERFACPETGGMIVELRGNGHQTIVPPSVHPSGETVFFSSDPGAEPEGADWLSLRKHCALLAIATVMIKRWQVGQRHTNALALAALLAKNGIGVQLARSIVDGIVSVAGDVERADRLQCVETTYSRHNAEEPVSSNAELERFFGPAIVQVFQRWLGSDPRSTAVSNVALTGSDGLLAKMRTDVDAGEAFGSALQSRLIYDDRAKTFYRNNNDVYVPVSYEIVQGIAVEFVKQALTEVSGIHDFAATKSIQSAARIKAMIDLCKSFIRVDSAEFDADPFLAGCANGVLDLRRRELLQPATIVTRKLGVAFDSAARCPRWIAFLGQIFADDREVISFVQRAISYTLTGSVSSQALFVLIGTGANGKSTLTRVVQQLLGDYATSTPMHTLMVSRYGSDKTDDLAALRGKRFVCAQEGESGQKLAEAKIKLMTGGDTITCRPLYGNLSTFAPQFKLWLATNQLPAISGTDVAIWRRINVIEFPVTIPAEKRDPNLQAVLLAELPGILNWALDGLATWEQEGLNPPEQVLYATDKYRSDNDTVGQFIRDACVRDPNAREMTKALHARYLEWCENSGLEALSLASFGKELCRLGLKQVRTSAGNGWQGIRLPPNDPTQVPY